MDESYSYINIIIQKLMDDVNNIKYDISDDVYNSLLINLKSIDILNSNSITNLNMIMNDIDHINRDISDNMYINISNNLKKLYDYFKIRSINNIASFIDVILISDGYSLRY